MVGHQNFQRIEFLKCVKEHSPRTKKIWPPQNISFAQSVLSFVFCFRFVCIYIYASLLNLSRLLLCPLLPTDHHTHTHSATHTHTTTLLSCIASPSAAAVRLALFSSHASTHKHSIFSFYFHKRNPPPQIWPPARSD